MLGLKWATMAEHERISRAESWTFLTNHAAVLVAISDDGELTTDQIAETVGISRRAVHMVLTDLELGGYITRERVGRRTVYSVHQDMRLRHPALSDRGTVGDILTLLDESTKAD